MLEALPSSTESSFKLDRLCKNIFNVDKIPIESLLGKKLQGSMLDVELDKLSHYACEDADYCLRLHEHYHPQLGKEGLSALYEMLELPIAPTLATMERHGVLLDQGKLGQLSEKLGAMATGLESEIYDIAGHEFNISSPNNFRPSRLKSSKFTPSLGSKT